MSPSTLLVLTFVGLVVGLFAFFWGTSLFLQSALYSLPANKLPVRAATAAFLVGGFLTMWTFVNTRADSKDRYGTLFEFNATSSHEFHEFTAVRRDANKKEKSVAYKKAGANYVEANDPSKPFKMNTSDYLVAAVEVKDGDKPVRYDAVFDKNGTYAGANKRFNEAGGRRYLEFGNASVPTPVYAPSRGALFAALGLNLLHFVVWFVALWPVLRYTSGHALGGAAGLGVFTMLLLMPLLFDKNKLPEVLPAAAAKP